MQDALRDKGWGDDNLTKQWYLDLDSTQDDVDANIETRKRYDYMHGYWHLLTAMFMMQQTLNIIVANSGKIEHLEIYAGFPETLALMQACKGSSVSSPLLPLCSLQWPRQRPSRS